jgi:hypothetical protein
MTPTKEKQKPLTVTDRDAKAAAVQERKGTIATELQTLGETYGDAMLAGDRAAADTAENAIVAARTESEHCDLELAAITRAKTALLAAQAREYRAELVKAHNGHLAAAGELLVPLVADVQALRPRFDAVREHLKAAMPLSLELTPASTTVEDRVSRPTWPEGLLRQFLMGALGHTFGEPYSDRLGHEAADKLLTLSERLQIHEGD